MNTLIPPKWVKNRIGTGFKMVGLALAAISLLAGNSAFSQATVTTLTDANHGSPGYKDGSTFYTAQFRFPAGIALDPSDTTLFMADRDNNAVRMITDVGNTGSSYTYSAYTSVDGISHPVAVVVDAQTNIYVLNRGSGNNGTLLKFNGAYYLNYGIKYLLSTNASNLTNATSLALDYDGNMYVTAQSNTVIHITPGGVISTVGVITNQGTSLRGVVVMDNGTLALTDAGNNGIWKMDPANTNLFDNSTPFTGFHGAADTNGPPAFSAFNDPENISKAGNDYLVVADYNNNKVKIIDPYGNVTRLYGVNKKYWSSSYPGWSDGTVNPNESADTVQARQPYGLTVANDGSVLVTETYYCLLRSVTGTGLPHPPPPPPAVPTILSVGTNYNQVTLSWSLVPNATSYNVKQSSQSGGPYTTIANVNATDYTDSTVINGRKYFYVVSALNGSSESANSSEVSATPPLPPVTDPQIGYVDTDLVFHPVASAVFNNDTPIVIVSDALSQTFYNYGPTTTNGIPNPTTNSASAPQGYSSGHDPSGYAVAQTLPDLTIKAISTKNDGSPNSAVVESRFQYITANPAITGTNAAQFTIKDITLDAKFLCTTDGSDPRSSTNAFVAGPVSGTNGVTLSLPFPANTNSMLFQAAAFKANYQTSSVVSMTFSKTNFDANSVDFGFASGPGSCQFVASPGQTFFVPIGLHLLDNHPPIYGLQFNVTLTNLDSSIVPPSTIAFNPLIGKPDKANDGYFEPIPPLEFISASMPDNDMNAIQYNGGWYQDLNFTDNNNNNDLLGVGWLEVYGRTNLYNTKSQNLLTYPIRDGTDVTGDSSKLIIGSYSFDIPSGANSGDRYQVQLNRPSGTTFTALDVDPYGTPVFFDAPADTNLVGPGSINALKNVTIGQMKYIVGDVYPANWYNAGDFGSGSLQNVDVIRIFDFAAYPIASPPAKSDLFNALDSCGNFGYMSQFGYYTNASVYPYWTNFVVNNYTTVIDTNGSVVSSTATGEPDYTTRIYMTTYVVGVPYYITNIYQAVPPAQPTTNVIFTNYVVNITPGDSTLFDVAATDTNINQIAFGDGRLDVCDVYVTFQRSLDHNLNWFRRFWTNGERVAEIVPNVTTHVLTKTTTSNTPVVQPKVQPSSVAPQVHFAAGDIQGSSGQVVQIPITTHIYGSYPLRVLMLNLTVEPLDGSPALTTPVQFNQIADLGSPYTTDSKGNGNYSAVWLNNTISGLTGDAIIGSLTVTIPTTASGNAAYAIHFDHASASPNGLGTFPKQTLTGLITLSSRTNSSYGDGIPDSWRLRWFGTVNNYLSVSNACPSGDGVNNWMKYVAGVDPNVANNFPSLKAKTPVPSGATTAIHWPSVSGKQYVIMRSTSLFDGSWTAISTNTGTGTDMEFDDNFDGAVKFYRVRILP